MPTSLLDHAESILKEAKLKVNRNRSTTKTPSREGYIDYEYYPIIREDGTQVGELVIDTAENSISITTFPNATKQEIEVMKKTEQFLNQINSSIGEE